LTWSGQALLNALDGICYLTDAEGRILQVGEPAWTASLQKAGVDASEPSVLGGSVFDAIQSPEVRHTYEVIHHAVVTGFRAHVAFELRCDGPDVRQLLRMSISSVSGPCGQTAVLYQSQVLSAVSRPWMSLFDPQRIVDRIRLDGGLPIVTVCSFCHRVAWPLSSSREWVAAEDYYRLGGPHDVRVSHGVCSDCASRLNPPDADADASVRAAGSEEDAHCG
jgi:hypothetical protein